MTTADDIFAAAPRGVVKYDVGGGVMCTLREMSVTEQMKWNEFYSEKKDDHEGLYCHLISLCCVEMQGLDPKEIADKLQSKAIMGMGNKIIDLCDLKEESAKKD
jgi:hypothetical protein